MMRKYLYLVLIIAMLQFVAQSCHKNDVVLPKYVVKRVTVSIDGIHENVYPWTSFNAYTQYNDDLYVVQGNDTAIYQKGGISIERGDFPASGQIVVFSKTEESSCIHIGVTYLKRMSAPSDSDDMTVRIKGYIDDVQCLDTTRVMHAFSKEDSIRQSDYIFSLNF